MDWANKKQVIRELKLNGEALKYATPILQDDKEVVLEAIKNTTLSIVYASEKLRDDEDIADIIIKSNPFSLIYLSNRLKEKYRKTSIIESKKYTLNELKRLKKDILKKINELNIELDELTIILYKNKLKEITKEIEVNENENK